MSRKRSHLLFLFFVCLLTIGLASNRTDFAAAQSSSIVISQLYGGGGNSGAPLTHDYVELFNAGTTSVSLNGLSIQYTSATGTGNFGANSGLLTELPDVSLSPGQYFLVQQAAGTAGSGDPLPTPDYIDPTPINMAAGSGKVALVTGTNSLGCNGGSTPCDDEQLERILDLVGYGTANFFEGAGAAPTLSNTTAAFRADNGCTDTDNNNADFTAGGPAPRNMASPLNLCQPVDEAKVVISQLYGGGGNTGAPLTHDYVELFNAGTTSVSLNGLSIQYTSATGTGNFGANSGLLTELPDVSLSPGQYFLVQQAAGTAGSGDPLPTPDYIDPTPIQMAAGSGKVVLVTGTDSLGCNGGSTPCDAEQLERILDLVGYGTANFFEGAGAAPTLSNTTAAFRAGNGCIDTDNNAADFTAGPPAPRNSASPLNLCDEPPPPPPPPGGECGDSFTPIYTIQGSDNVTPLLGEVHATEGVVVGDFTGSSRLNGFFIQDPVGDGDHLTSDGLFVFSPAASGLNEGDLVRVFGRVTEFFGLTQIDQVQNLLICDTGIVVEPTAILLPLPDPVDGVPYLERYEGMLVVFPQELTATDHFNLGRFGEVTLSVDGRLFNPTNVVAPGLDANALQAENDRRQILLDDGSNLQNPVPPPPFFAADGTLRLGDTTQNLTGVMSFGFSSYRIQPTQPVEFIRINERTEFPDGVGGTIRVASFNVLNYFTTLDTGAPICGPEQNQGCRGANTPEEFERQRVKIIEAIVRLDADVIGLIELENNPSESLQDLVDGLNDELGPGTYDFIDTGTIGGDAIKLGIIYQPARVTPFGDYAILDSSVDARFLDDKNRPVLAQSFDASGEIFTVAINHLKSKGSPCDDVEDPDLGDGQANCNLTRTKAALAMADWLASDPTGSGDPDVFILGDLNAYRLEDPITALKEEGGYTDLVDLFIGEEAYSYVFFGQAGYLDHALATPSVVDRVTGVTIWAINADEPRALDYNDFTQPSLFQPDQYRSSDHDPVLVGFCDAVAPTLNVSVTPDVLWPPDHQYVRVTASVSVFDNFDPSPLLQLLSVTSNEPDNGLGDGDMPNDIVIIDDFTFDLRAERSGLGDGRIYTITYQATDSCGNSSIEYATVTVPKSQDQRR
jgi:uncharacterized protein